MRNRGLFWTGDRVFADPSGWALCGFVCPWFSLTYTPRRRLLPGMRPFGLLWLAGRWPRYFEFGRLREEVPPMT